MNFKIRDFTIDDYEAAIGLWKTDAHIGLSQADEKDNIGQFLEGNGGLSKVAVCRGQIVGTALCGHDCRRGYIYHLFVDQQYRRKGLGKSLVESCMDSLNKQKIQKCHLFVFNTNEAGKIFWNNTLWKERHDIAVFSKDTGA